nr:MAG TPA: hypothetical protein [Caudoviricetes sp.]
MRERVECIPVRVKLIKLDSKRRWKPKRFSFDF